MKKLLLLFAVLLFVLPLVPAETQALPIECELAAYYGWHANWANTSCILAMMAGFDDGYGDGGGMDGWR